MDKMLLSLVKICKKLVKHVEILHNNGCMYNETYATKCYYKVINENGVFLLYIL